MGERTRELLVLITGDIFIFIVSLWFTLLVRYGELPNVNLFEAHLWPFLTLSFLWLFIFYISGLYDKHTVFVKSLLVGRIAHAQLINVFLAGVIFLTIPFGITPKTNLVIYLGISTILLSLWRLKLFNRLTPKSMYKAVLIADGDEAIELVDEVNNNDRYHYSFVRIIDSVTAGNTPDFEKKLQSLMEKENIDMVVADPKLPHLAPVLPTLFDLAFIKFECRFFDFHHVYEETFDRVPLSSLHYDWFITHVSQRKRTFYDLVKRGIDILGALAVGSFFLLLLPFIYLAMRFEGNKQIFMWQKRIGQFNTPVWVLKVQTMTKNDVASSTWLVEDEKQKNTVTKVGAILRKTSIDEMPQAWNILKGEMSMIGPRNDIEGLGQRLAKDIPYYNIRNFVKPGVTGWAQTHQFYQGENISPQSLAESKMRLAYDLYYVKNRSVWLDIEIALRTIKTLVSRFGVNFFSSKAGKNV